MRSVALLATVTLALPATLPAGTVKGRVELIEKGGRKATDLSDVVVYLDGARAKPRPARGAPVPPRHLLCPSPSSAKARTGSAAKAATATTAAPASAIKTGRSAKKAAAKSRSSPRNSFS